MATWNIGNTTVRNPNRIELGLALVIEKKLGGKLHGEEAENNFSQLLVTNKVVDSKGTYSDLLGRKWRSAMVQLGFLTDAEYKIKGKNIKATDFLPSLSLDGIMQAYEVTPVGRRLYNAQTAAEKQDIYLRQLLHFQLPNPLVRKNKIVGKFHPFTFLLSCTYELQRRSEKGLSKTEIGIFLQIGHADEGESIIQCIEEILKYRRERDCISGKRKKLAFDRKLLSEVAEKNAVKYGTLMDYADTTIRYFLMSGLFTFDKRRLVVREERKRDVDTIIAARVPYQEDEAQFVKDFYVGIQLPTDNRAIVIERITTLSREIGAQPVSEGKVRGMNEKELVSLKYELEEKVALSHEGQFALNQQKKESIIDIVNELNKFEKNDVSLRDLLDRAAYFEWLVWRVFLAIDNIVCDIDKTRGFPLDQDLMPRHPAAGGRPDMSFEFEDYELVVEVTLANSERQVMTESEPVRRHIADRAASSRKRVLGLFIAPKIDNNMLNPLRDVYYYKGDSPVHLDIVAMSIGQLKNVLEQMLTRTYGPEQIRMLIDSILAYKHLAPPEWKIQTEQIISAWQTA